MTSLEWKIHKKLLDAGGKDSSIYICWGRGSGKSETERRLIEELQAEGRTVVHVRLEDLRIGRTMPAPVPDLDILEQDRLERAESWVKTFYDAAEKLKKDCKPRYIPEYELFKDFYVIDEDEPIYKKADWPRPYPDWPFIYW